MMDLMHSYASIIAKKKFKSRLIVGTGKYKNMRECAKSVKLSGAEIVTVAVRRVNISDKNKYSYKEVLEWINAKRILFGVICLERLKIFLTVLYILP